MDRMEEMRTFTIVAQHGVTGASRVLHIAPSAISRRVKDLEHRLGVDLFKRTTRSMTLTGAGAAFLEDAKRILEDVDNAEHRIKDAHTSLRGRIKLAAPLSFALLHLGDAISQFMANHPEIQIELDLNDRRVDLLGEGFDLAIRIGPLVDSTLKARKLADYPYRLVASPAYLKSRGTPISIEDLSEHDVLAYGANTDPDRITYSDQDGTSGAIRIKPRLISNNGDILRNCAMAGLGIIKEPHFMVEQALADGSLIEILPDYIWGAATATLLRPDRSYVPERISALADHIHTTLAKRH
ncbi:MAG: LysR substrate-binding domain-containing protein [Pseudomonadota bacterium]